MNTASWVIREKATGRVVCETFIRATAEAINKDKYEAIPVLQHLQEVNAAIKEAA